MNKPTKVARIPRLFFTMSLEELCDHVGYLDQKIGEAAKTAENARIRFKQYNYQHILATEMYRNRRAALEMDPTERLMTLVEDLSRRGWHMLAAHVSDNWAEDDGVVVIIGLEEFGKEDRASLVTAAESCGFQWRGW